MSRTIITFALVMLVCCGARQRYHSPQVILPALVVNSATYPAIVFQSSTTNYVTNATAVVSSVTTTNPTCNVGDLLVAAMLNCGSGTAGFVTPTGWTKMDEELRTSSPLLGAATFYQVATNGASGATTTWTYGGTAGTWQEVYVMRWTGNSTVTPIQAHVTWDPVGPYSVWIGSSPLIITSAANIVAIAMPRQSVASFSAITTYGGSPNVLYTNRIVDLGGTRPAFMMADSTLTSDGFGNARDFTVTIGTSRGGACWQFAINHQ